MKEYDLIIIGSGPAGLTAGIYASRYNLNFLIIGELPGGAISEAHKVCNYPSQNEISGFELTQKMLSHLKSLKGEVRQKRIDSIKKGKDFFMVKTSNEEYKAKKIVLATGRDKIKLDVPGEEELLGKGVSYCATCDAAFYKDKVVSVVGGGNSAITAALLLSEYAKKVYIIYRKDSFFRAEPAWIEQLEKEKKIEPVFNAVVTKINGKDSVESVVLDNGKKLEVDGIFIEIGFKPKKDFVDELGLKTDEKGYIITDKFQKTNISGLFAAGDGTDNHLKQVITASAEGAIAVTSAYEELKLEK